MTHLPWFFLFWYSTNCEKINFLQSKVETKNHKMRKVLDVTSSQVLKSLRLIICWVFQFFASDERIKAVRKMIMAVTSDQRKAALDVLLPFQRSDFEGIFHAMDGTFLSYEPERSIDLIETSSVACFFHCMEYLVLGLYYCVSWFFFPFFPPRTTVSKPTMKQL